MNAIVEAKRYTPEDLLKMPDGKRYELVEGHLVEREMSVWSSYVAGRVFARIDAFNNTHRLGWVFPEGTSYRCFPDAPTKVRRPDTSFIEMNRLSPEAALSEGHVPLEPDLAVEVISPNDLAYDVAEKVQEFREAGVKLIWVVHPFDRTVTIHRNKGKATIAYEDDELDGENVLPGFRCRVRDLFLPPAGETSAQK